MKEEIRKRLLECGAADVGFAKAGEIDADIHNDYCRWIEEGCGADMGYLQRHIPLRRHTDNVLPGGNTVISLAFNYTPRKWRDERLPIIAAYAYSTDYHKVIKSLLAPEIAYFRNKFGGSWRVCVDSAPVAERYWAVKSGIGYRGLNGSVITEKCGSFCFLAEILTTHELTPDEASEKNCLGCRACLEVCPGKAIRDDGTIDSRRCINYLTIEKKEDFSDNEKQLLNTGKGYLFGCDKCLRICPHNKIAKGANNLFPIRENIKQLTPEEILEISEKEFNTTFKGTPLIYAGYQKLQRNAAALKNKRD